MSFISVTTLTGSLTCFLSNSELFVGKWREIISKVLAGEKTRPPDKGVNREEERAACDWKRKEPTWKESMWRREGRLREKERTGCRVGKKTT